MALQVWLPLNGDLKNQGLSNNIIATPVNTLTFEESDGILGNGISFKGDSTSKNGISLNSNFLDIINNDCSISVWIKVFGNHPDYTATIISSGNWNTGNQHWVFGLNKSNTSVNVLSMNVQDWLACPIPTNTWTHLVCTKEGTISKVYKNGVYIGQKTVAATFGSNYNVSHIGRCTYGNYFGFNGLINDLRIYDHVLSLKEIKKLSQGLVLHYLFNQENLTNIPSVKYTGEKVSFTANNVIPLQDITAIIKPSQTKYGIASPTNIRVLGGRTSVTIYQNKYNYVDQDLLLQASGWAYSTDTDFITYQGVPIYKGTIVNLYNKFGNGKYLPIYGAEAGKQYIIGCWWRSVSATTSNGIKMGILYSDGTSTAATPATQSANQTWKLRSVLSVASKKIIGLTFSYNSSFPIYMAGLMCIEKSIYDSLGGNNVIFNNDIWKYTLSLNGTNYGSKYNISTGVCNKTHELLTLPTTGWGYANGIFYLENALPARSSGVYDSTKWFCNQYAVAAAQTTTTNAANAFADFSIGAQSGNYPRRVLIKDSRYTDKDSFMAGLTTPISIVYDKETPEVNNLSTQSINTWVGLNNIFTNCGDIELIYGDQGNRNIIDTSGFNNNGTVVGTLNIRDDGPKYSKILLVNGSGNRINCNTGNFNFNEKKFSFSVWCKRNTFVSGAKICAIKVGSLKFNFGETSDNSESQFFIFDGTKYWGSDIRFIMPLNEWHHWVGTFDGSTIKLYKDGNLFESGTKTTNYTYTLTDDSYFLGTLSGVSSNAYVSDMCLYSTVLSADDIKELYKTSKIVSGTTLTA